MVRAAGVQSEMALAFAGLHQLCAPLLDRLDRLPEPQRDALRTAFGLSAGEAPDRFVIGLAVLTLLAEVLPDLPALVVDGLRNGDARALLTSVSACRWMCGCATGSSPRPAAIRWRGSSCPAG